MITLQKLLLILSLGIVSSLFAIASEPAPPLKLDGVRVMLCAPYSDILDLPVAKNLEKAGAEVRAGELEGLTWDSVKKFNLIIMVVHSTPKENKAEVLSQFVNAGGGLLFFRFPNHDQGTDVDALLAPFDASMLQQQVDDPLHTFTSNSGFGLKYAYTGKIAPDHPVTRGVAGIWFPTGPGAVMNTSPFKISDKWTALVTGEQGARVLPMALINEHQKDEIKTDEPQVLVAGREFGKGAIVLFGTSPIETFYGQELPAFGGVALKKGNSLIPSDFGRLYDNSLMWLSAHALASSEVGTGDLSAVKNSWTATVTLDKKQVYYADDLAPQPLRGVIGLHSNLSDGKSSPQALIAKAKSLGLQWVAFSEHLEDFSREKWESLREICRESSDSKFVAFPGLDYADNTGTRYVVYSDFPWPPEEVFSPDKKRIIVPEWWFNAKAPAEVAYNLTHSPLSPWDLSLYDGAAIQTTVAGKVVDSDMAPFRFLQGIMDDPFPAAISMCYDEDQLKAASGEMCNFLMATDVSQLKSHFDKFVYYNSNLDFASNGPIVTDWRMENGTRTSGGEWFLAGSEEYQIKLSVHSDVPINDIKIYDGPRLFWRLQPKEKSLTIRLNIPHDQQRNLFAEITDANGKQAVTGGLFIRDLLNWRFMCPDRQNSICDAVRKDELGPYLMNPSAPYQRKMSQFLISPGYGSRPFEVIPPHLDGGLRAVPINPLPSVTSKDILLSPPSKWTDVRMEIPVCSRDGILQDETVMGYFPERPLSNISKFTPIKIKDATIRYRYLNVTQRAHDPSAMLVEGKITFHKDALIDSIDVVQVGGVSDPGRSDHYAISGVDGAFSGLTSTPPVTWSGNMLPGNYGCIFPSIWGSSGIVVLDEGYRLNLRAAAPNINLSLGLQNFPRQVKAGETLTYRFVAFQGDQREGSNTLLNWDRFIHSMGFQGKPDYEVKNIGAGKVKSTKFLLELQPEHFGFVGTVTKADLPIRLPIRIEGMNPNWTFAYIDLDRKEWFPSAVDPEIRQGYFSLDTRAGDHRIFAGHPVISDNPNLKIIVTWDAFSDIEANVNNTGDETIETTIQLNPALGGAESIKIRLSPGETKVVKLSFGT